MKKFLIFFFCFVSAVLAQQSVKPNAVDDSLKLLFQNNMQVWMNAYNGGDATKLVPLYAEDAEYISGHVAGLVAAGRDRLIENFQNGMTGGGHIDSIVILSVNVSCDLATLVCKYEATNSGVKATGRNLVVLKKINGDWLIVTHMTVV